MAEIGGTKNEVLEAFEAMLPKALGIQKMLDEKHIFGDAGVGEEEQEIEAIIAVGMIDVEI